jgi:translation initiation factor IF-2
MQQRRPRLGDILDDYCPRERRVTNHAVVAIVDDDVKQTRCSTCDAEHEYRQAKTPAPRRTKSSAALTEAADGAKPVLAVARPLAEPERAAADVPDVPDVPDLPDVPAVAPPETAALADSAVALDSAPASEQDVAEPPDPREDDGPVHRRLIRATFPRPEGQVPERREPEFTIRQPGGRPRGEVDGNRVGYRGTSRNQRHGQPGGFGNFGARPHNGGFGADGQRGQRPPGPRGDNRQGGGGPNRGQRPGGGAGRKGPR